MWDMGALAAQGPASCTSIPEHPIDGFVTTRGDYTGEGAHPCRLYLLPVILGAQGSPVN